MKARVLIMAMMVSFASFANANIEAMLRGRGAFFMPI